MKKLIYSLFLITLLTPSIYSQMDVWLQTTNSVGTVWAMVIDPSNQDIMYSGSNNLGVYKTTNGGANWTAMNSGLTSTAVQSLAISQNNPQYLYAGTAAGGGVYRTTNGGTNWTQINTGITESSIAVQALLVHPTDPNIAWVCIFDGLIDATNGIYKTTNGGTSWFSITNGIGTIKNFLALAMSPVDPNTIYLGSSFSVASQTGPSAIYKSTDGGNNWVLSSSGLPTDPTEINPVRTIQVSSANPNVVIAGLFVNTVTLLGGFYLSTDAGANWVQKNNGLPIVQSKLIRSSAIRPLFDNQFYLGLDYASGTDIGVWGTTDGGNNWFNFNNGAMQSTYAIRALVFNSTGTHTLFAGCSSTTGNGVYEYNYSVVPVELVSFSAEVYSSNVTLSWITATEINNQGFEIQRKSSVENEWTNIEFVSGYGNSTEIRYYSFTDNSLPVGNYSYRLKQIDYSGEFTYSDEVEVTILAVNEFTLKQNYPNPINPSTRITFSIPNSSFVTLKVHDVLGNEIRTLIDNELPEGSYEVQFDGGNLPSGVYFYTLTAGDHSKTMKMNLLK